MKRVNYRNKYGYTWINVASGYTVLDDFINLDNNIFFALARGYPFIGLILGKERSKAIEKYAEAKKRAVFLKYDCRKPLPFSDASVDHILCSHFLEHLYPEYVSRIITDFQRILKHGGTLHIILPDLNRLIEEYMANKGSENAADILLKKMLMSSETRPSFRFRFLEFLGFEGLKHRWMYTSASMSLRLKSCGFELIENGNNMPSAHVRANDGESTHLFARNLYR
jgi:predicted SAM-dependent methyltransferase